MTDIETAGPVGRVRRGRWWAWPVAVAVDLTLGYLAALFLYIAGLQVSWWAGWAEPDPTWNDGDAATMLLIAPGVLLTGVFAGVTFAVRSFARVRALPLIGISLACYLAPVVLIIVRPDWWAAIRWY